MKNINTIDSLLREIWKYEPNILKLIFKFLFVPVSQDKERKYRYIEALPIPGTTYINKKAFSNCVSLQCVIISNFVKTIGNCAFLDCVSLQNVMFGNSVETIGNMAFECCSMLQNVVIPYKVKNIGHGAFSYCKDLNSLTISNFVETKREESLKSDNIYKNVKAICSFAFYNCKSLKYVIIPKYVENISKWAFIECSSLKYASISKNLEETVSKLEVFPKQTLIIVR